MAHTKKGRKVAFVAGLALVVLSVHGLDVLEGDPLSLKDRSSLVP